MAPTARLAPAKNTRPIVESRFELFPETLGVLFNNSNTRMHELARAD